MKPLYLLLSIFVIMSCNKTISPDKASKNNSLTSSEALAIDGLNALFRDYDLSKLKALFSENYIQHNPGVPTGRAPVEGFLPALKEAGTSVQIHRVFQDGEFVVLHNTYDNAEAFGAKEIVTFDVFRVENGKLAEHWDAVQPLERETKSGRSMVDGPTEFKELDKTEANKALIKVFMADILMGQNPQKITDYISAETYHQHNPQIADGLEGITAAFQYLTSINDVFTYTKIHKILGKGNFVLTMSEGDWHGKKHAFYDLFRIEDNMLVEHWDVIQEIPADMAHSNGMF